MSNTFEVKRIINDKVRNGVSYYLVQWNNTTTINISTYKCHKKDMKRIIRVNNKFIIEWKNTWMKFEDIREGCDEILGAYLLLKLHNF